MDLQLTDAQKAFVQEAIARGRYAREEDAVADALALWEERERRRTEILFAIDCAEAAYARGEGDVVTNDKEAAELFEQICAEGARLFAAKAH